MLYSEKISMIECTCQERPLYVLGEWSAVFAIVQIALYTHADTHMHKQYNEACVKNPAPVMEW